MSYEIKGSAVLWLGKKIAGASAGDFKQLTPVIAVDAGRVYVRGKPAKDVHRAGFSLLNSGFATDGVAVFRILDTKLKPLTDADPATFQCLTDDFAHDAKLVWYADTRVRLSKGATPADLRHLDGALATDGVALIYGTKKIVGSQKAGVDWTNARAEMIGAYDGINPPHGKVTDGERVWWLGPTKDDFGLTPIAASYDRLDAIPSDRDWRQYLYCSDGISVWYRGALVEGADTSRLWVQSPKVLEAGDMVFAAGQPTGWAVGDAQVSIQIGKLGRLVHGQGALQAITYGDQLQPLCDGAKAGAPPVDAALTALFQGLVSDVFGCLDQVDRMAHSLDEYAANLDPGLTSYADRLDLSLPPVHGVAVQLVGQDVSLTVGKHQLQGSLAGWLGLIQRLWLLSHGHKGDWAPWTSRSAYPRGTDFHDLLCRRNMAEMIEATGRAHEAGAIEGAEAMMMLAMRSIHFRNYVPETMNAPLARLPLPLVAWHREIGSFRSSIDKTTNLGAGRYLLNSQEVMSESWTTRLEALELLNGVVWATDKTVQLTSDVLPWVEGRFADEPHPLCREVLVSIVSTAAAKARRFSKRHPEDGRRLERAALRLACDLGIDPGPSSARLAALET